jgi:hypothetical protein
MPITLKGSGQAIVQIQSTTLTTNLTVSAGTTAVDLTGLSVNITPTSASNRILVLVNIQFNNASFEGFVGLVNRNGTLVAQNTAGGSTAGCFSLSTANSNVYWLMSSSASFIDSPATTSPLTYKLQTATVSGTYTLYVNRTQRGNSNDASGTSTITVMEISG